MGNPAKEDPEDDGRVIADMSDVDTGSVLSGIFMPRRLPRRAPDTEENTAEKAAPAEEMAPEDRHAFVLGAMKAVFLIGLAYIVGLGGVILLLLLIWRAF